MSHCLIIDDSAVVRKVAKRILEEAGYAAVEAADGSEALIACRREMPKLVILDGMMPGMSAFDFLLMLRKMDGGKEPKVIFCTTENDVSQIARAYRSGANYYVQKPFDRDILIGKIAETGALSPEVGGSPSTSESETASVA